jgi:hypothetical protein
MKTRRSITRILLMTSCVLALVALALMGWSVLVPRPVPVIVAMSVGQGIGTLSLVLYLVVVGLDVRRVLEDEKPPSGP